MSYTVYSCWFVEKELCDIRDDVMRESPRDLEHEEGEEEPFGNITKPLSGRVSLIMISL